MKSMKQSVISSGQLVRDDIVSATKTLAALTLRWLLCIILAAFVLASLLAN